MIFGLILGFLITLCTGYFAVSLIEREMELRFRLLFAIPLGFGISSVLYFLYVFFNINNFKAFEIAEIALAIVLALFYYNEEKPDMSKHKFKKLSNWFYLLNLYAVLIFLKYFINNPMGSWDGFRIWNIKAEFLALNSPLWQNMFSLPHFMSHNDYPLLLPSLTARLWNYTGAHNFAVNATIGLFFTFGLVYLLFQAIEYFKRDIFILSNKSKLININVRNNHVGSLYKPAIDNVAIAVTSVFMILDVFIVNGAHQCADVPLAFMFLSAVVCLFMYFKKEKFSYIILGIIFSALGAWTKNEGMMFCVIYLGTIFVWFLKEKSYKYAFLALATGAIPLCGLMLFKHIVNFQNDLIAGFFAIKSYNFALDLYRYAVIFKTFFSMIFTRFTLLWVLLLLCVKGFRIKEQNKKPFALACIIFALCTVGYFLVYLISPHDIIWLAENSMDRIILQMLPVFLFLFSVNLRIGKPDSIK